MALSDLQSESTREWDRVGNMFEVSRKPRNLPPLQDGLVPFAPMDAVPANRHVDPDYEMRPWTGRGTGTYFERGDILVARITPSFENGKQATTDNLTTPFGFATTEVIPVHPMSPEGTDSRLLFFYLLHPEVRRFLADRMEGSTGRQRISESVLLDLPYPKFTSDEQQRMGDILSGLFAAIDGELEAELGAGQLRDSLLRDLFTEATEGRHPDGWVSEELGDRCVVSSGGTPSRGEPEYWIGGTIPWVKTGEVNYGVITGTDEHITERGLAESAAKLLPPNTLLLAMYGQGVTRGRVAVLGIEAACNQACAAIHTDASVLLPKFLFYVLMAQYDFIRGRAHGGQQQNLNLDLVRGLPIAFPADLGVQHRMVAVLDAIGEVVDLHGEKVQTLRALFISLLEGLLLGAVSPDQLGDFPAQGNTPEGSR